MFHLLLQGNGGGPNPGGCGLLLLPRASPVLSWAEVGVDVSKDLQIVTPTEAHTKFSFVPARE